VQLKGYSKVMAQAMTKSLTIPHFGYDDEYQLDKLIILRKRLKPEFEMDGISLSYMPFIIKAVSMSLKKIPIIKFEN